jgi:NTE family protein
VGIACQGGGSHTAFTAGALTGLLTNLPDDVEVVGLSGTSGGAICAALAWDGLIHGDTERAVRKLAAFWDANAAKDPFDQFANSALMAVMDLKDSMILPDVSPYRMPTWGADKFRGILEGLIDFPAARRQARSPGVPALFVGAVEVVSGEFEAFTGHELMVECLLASAAIPELFRAVHVPGRGTYWDGLFSQNPPIHELTQVGIDELWLIQVNPTACGKVPTETCEISDRRNALSGNLSVEQELRHIESINRSIARGYVTDPKFRPIHIGRVRMERELGYKSKLDRRPEFLTELMEFGAAKARLFLREREGRKYAIRAYEAAGPVAASVTA